MENKVALVTGAAGGIGAAIARALGEQGATVAACDNDPTRLGETVAKMATDGLRIQAFPVDVTNSSEVESTVDAIEYCLGPIDYLVNAAGVLRLGETKTFTDEDWATTLAVNTTGVFHVSRAVVYRMVPRSRGAIVTIASNAARTPRTDMAAYAASKAASAMFTKCLGLEVAKHGIRCNVVSPGSTDTQMLRSMWRDESGQRATIMGRPDAFRVGIPLRKIAHPADIADAAVFLLSDRAAHITMHEMTVDGGAGLGA